jgi:hypothetical protein
MREPRRSRILAIPHYAAMDLLDIAIEVGRCPDVKARTIAGFLPSGCSPV